MILRFSSWQTGLSLAVLTAGLLLPGKLVGAEKQQGRKIEFYDPKGSDATTNFNQLNPKRGGLRDLEDDLTKSFQKGFSSHGSLDGVVMPVPSRPGPNPVIQSKKLKEILERKKNWAFSTPEDLTTGPTAAELLNLPEYGTDGKEKKPRSSVENYYERLEREHKGTSEKGDREHEDGNLFGLRKQSDLPEDQDSKEGRDLPGDINQTDRTLRRLFDLKSGGTYAMPESGRSSISDFFGRDIVTPSAAQTEIHNIHLNKYRELLGISTMPSDGTAPRSSLSGIGDVHQVAPASGLENLPSSSRSSGFEGTFGILGSPSSPLSLPDLSPKTVNPWNLPAATPKADAPRMMMLPSSGLDLPLRKF